MSSSKPIIAIIACQKQVDGQLAQSVYKKYIDAVNFYGGNPILLPFSAEETDNFNAIIAVVDGILLTGSYSNVAPERYNASHIEANQDLSRDALSFKLLAYAQQQKVPLLAICRGLQEMNVYFGGTLYPDWRDAGKFFEPHLENSDDPIEVQYQPVHDVIMQPNGKLAEFNTRWRVNSLHKQAINNVGHGLTVEAVAPDTLVEAISLANHPFMIGVQWHPEVNYKQDAMSRFLFSEFITHAKQTNAQR